MMIDYWYSSLVLVMVVIWITIAARGGGRCNQEHDNSLLRAFLRLADLDSAIQAETFEKGFCFGLKMFGLSYLIIC